MKIRVLLSVLIAVFFVSCSKTPTIEIEIPEMNEGKITVLYADPQAVAYSEQSVLYQSDFSQGKIKFKLDSLNFEKDIKECALIIVSKDNSIKMNVPLPVERGKELDVKITNILEYNKGGVIKVSYEGSSHAEDFSKFWGKMQSQILELYKADPTKIDPIYSKLASTYKDYISKYPNSGFPYMLLIPQIQNMQIDNANPLLDYCNTLCMESNEGKWKDMLCGLLAEKRLALETSKKLVFSAVDLKGDTYTERDVRGKLIMADFWASWCKPCKEEMPHLKDLYIKYKAKGFNIIGISIDRSIEEWKAFLVSNNLPWLSLFGNGEALTKRYDFQYIPFNLLVDEQGNIIGKNLHGQDLDKYLENYFSK